MGASVPRRGNGLVVGLGRALLALLGWKIEGEIPDRAKFVIAVGPHTSNWDFVVGMAAMFALDLRLMFIGKHTLFFWPLAPFLRWMGGIPVDRASHHGLVEQAVRAFEAAPKIILAIAPEGTRRRGASLKSGFLHIALGARVPVLLAALDYERRAIRLGPLFFPSATVQDDLARTQAHFAGVRGKHPR